MPLMTGTNPFGSEVASAHSNYCRPEGRTLVRNDGQRPSSLTEFVHDGFRALVLNEHFACVGAKAAVRQGSYRFALYRDLASAGASAGLAYDLYTFVRERPSLDGAFTTFVAAFAGAPPADETEFERRLWDTLQQLHDLDARFHSWDGAVEADPTDPRFSFSFAGTALFVVGLHAASSRNTRRFAWPTLVFNPHDQFDDLRSRGQYSRFREVIRDADRALQGDVNPMLSTFGERSEASQYSGRRVDDNWSCPFHTRLAERDDTKGQP